MKIDKIVTKQEWDVNRCAICGATLLNPGYGKVSVFHCGKYQRWGQYVDRTYRVTGETGRDERGRFCGKAYLAFSRIEEKRV
jgi:hypothetical protein